MAKQQSVKSVKHLQGESCHLIYNDYTRIHILAEFMEELDNCSPNRLTERLKPINIPRKPFVFEGRVEVIRRKIKCGTIIILEKYGAGEVTYIDGDSIYVDFRIKGKVILDIKYFPNLEHAGLISFG